MKFTENEVLSLQRVIERHPDVYSRGHTYMQHLKTLLEKIKPKSEEVKFESIPKYGNHMSAYSWRRACEDGLFSEWDGRGYWATENKMSRKNAFSKKRPDWATHVVWFNK